MRKAKNFTSSPFSFYIKVLSFQGWFESINAYAAFLTEFLIFSSFRKAAFLISSFKISRRYKGSGSPTTTSTLEGIPLIFYSQLPVIFKEYILHKIILDL